MSRAFLVVGLVLSVAVHVWVLSIPRGMTLREIAAPIIVPVVETKLAELLRPEPKPQVEVEKVAAAEPVPEPEPKQPEPAPEPEAKPEPAQVPEPPHPELVKVAEPPEASVEEPGDFAGGDAERPAPQLRIDWGSDEEARAILDAGGMVLAVLDADGANPVITQQVFREETGWQRRPYQPGQTKLFSNRLRIVDHVPAFDAVCREVGLRSGERLAVVVPMRVERVLESAQMEAAFSRGLTMATIENFAGRFTLEGGRVAFVITHVGAIAGSVSP